jgi:hypothetical protein
MFLSVFVTDAARFWAKWLFLGTVSHVFAVFID